jgi:hypothetical protein
MSEQQTPPIEPKLSKLGILRGRLNEVAEEIRRKKLQASTRDTDVDGEPLSQTGGQSEGVTAEDGGEAAGEGSETAATEPPQEAGDEGGSSESGGTVETGDGAGNEEAVAAAEDAVEEAYEPPNDPATTARGSIIPPETADEIRENMFIGEPAQYGRRISAPPPVELDGEPPLRKALDVEGGTAVIGESSIDASAPPPTVHRDATYIGPPGGRVYNPAGAGDRLAMEEMQARSRMLLAGSGDLSQQIESMGDGGDASAPASASEPGDAPPVDKADPASGPGGEAGTERTAEDELKENTAELITLLKEKNLDTDEALALADTIHGYFLEDGLKVNSGVGLEGGGTVVYHRPSDSVTIISGGVVARYERQAEQDGAYMVLMTQRNGKFEPVAKKLAESAEETTTTSVNPYSEQQEPTGPAVPLYQKVPQVVIPAGEFSPEIVISRAHGVFRAMIEARGDALTKNEKTRSQIASGEYVEIFEEMKRVLWTERPVAQKVDIGDFHSIIFEGEVEGDEGTKNGNVTLIAYDEPIAAYRPGLRAISIANGTLNGETIGFTKSPDQSENQADQETKERPDSPIEESVKHLVSAGFEEVGTVPVQVSEQDTEEKINGLIAEAQANHRAGSIFAVVDGSGRIRLTLDQSSRFIGELSRSKTTYLGPSQVQESSTIYFPDQEYKVLVKDREAMPGYIEPARVADYANEEELLKAANSDGWILHNGERELECSSYREVFYQPQPVYTGIITSPCTVGKTEPQYINGTQKVPRYYVVGRGVQYLLEQEEGYWCVKQDMDGKPLPKTLYLGKQQGFVGTEQSKPPSAAPEQAVTETVAPTGAVEQQPDGEIRLPLGMAGRINRLSEKFSAIQSEYNLYEARSRYSNELVQDWRNICQRIVESNKPKAGMILNRQIGSGNTLSLSADSGITVSLVTPTFGNTLTAHCDNLSPSDPRDFAISIKYRDTVGGQYTETMLAGLGMDANIAINPNASQTIRPRSRFLNEIKERKQGQTQGENE